MSLRAIDVFTPGTYPQHTYVDRGQQKFEQQLRDALDTPGQVVSLSGPSKAGKTVLVERVVGRDLLITVTGASIEKPDDVWTKILNWIEAPESTSSSQSVGAALGGEILAKGSAGLPLVVKGEVGVTAKAEGSYSATTTTSETRRGMSQVVKEIANSEFVVLLDDFHYMARETQAEVAKSLKEAVRLGIKIVTAAVSHRGDDIIRANPELRGRVHSIDLKYWEREELAQIAYLGFGALNTSLESFVVDKFTVEAAGSPQLMQSLCLQACFVADLRQKHEGIIPVLLNLPDEQFHRVMEQTSAGTDFRSLVDVLDEGPRTRGTDRKTYQFQDGRQGDVYTAVLRAVAADPPQLSFSYSELLDRAAQVCKGESPIGSSVISTCSQMAKIALEKFPKERTIDWDESKFVFDLPDPYLMFYLRWSGRLQRDT